MGTDRFVYWNKRRPKREEVQHVITDYLGGFLDDMRWEKHDARRGVFFITLEGWHSDPLHHIKGAYRIPQMPGSDGRRYLEVVVDPKYVDVVTRLGDEATCALAEGLAAVFARFWEGRRDD